MAKRIFVSLVVFICLMLDLSSAHAGRSGQQALITQFMRKAEEEPAPHPVAVRRIIPPLPAVPVPAEEDRARKRRGEELSPVRVLKQARTSSQPHPGVVVSGPKTEKVHFLQGTDEHLYTYARLINSAESHIILASWKLSFIPEQIFQSLMEAKRRGVYISFIVNETVRPATLEYFEDDEEDEDMRFTIAETSSHAKFLCIDAKELVIGSFNALDSTADDETEDASLHISGSVRQVWPYYMRIRDTYTELDEQEVCGIFGGTAAISHARYGPREHLHRTLHCCTQIHLLKTVKDHEEFFRLAVPHNGAVTLYSPFSTRDNTLHRLRQLAAIVPSDTPVTLKVLPKFESGLRRLLDGVPALKSHTHVATEESHQKILVLGDEAICIGSLNWLSAAYREDATYGNLELSIVLQGPVAADIIRRYYTDPL